MCAGERQFEPAACGREYGLAAARCSAARPMERVIEARLAARRQRNTIAPFQLPPVPKRHRLATARMFKGGSLPAGANNQPSHNSTAPIQAGRRSGQVAGICLTTRRGPERPGTGQESIFRGWPSPRAVEGRNNRLWRLWRNADRGRAAPWPPSPHIHSPFTQRLRACFR